MRFDPNEPMALYPDAVNQFLGLVAGKDLSLLKENLNVEMQLLSEENPSEQIPLAALDSPSQKSMIAVVPVFGALTPDGWYGTSLDDFPRIMRSLDANANVGTIVLNVRSPGGTVTGTPEAAEAVRAVRDAGNTRIVAIANGMMASAALWIGSGAEKLYVTPSGEIGSIGVISMYTDWSAAYEAAGIKVSVMRVPEKKARFSGIEPMTDEMRSMVESRISESYDKFKRAVASNRGIRHDHVEAKFGGGEMMTAQAAKEAGLVDDIMTVEQLLASLATSKPQRAPASTRTQLAKAML